MENGATAGAVRALRGCRLLLCAVLAAPCLAAPAAPAPMRLVTGRLDAIDPCTGIRFVVLEEALQRRLGIPFRCEQLPWARAQQKVRDGEVDGMVSVPTAERLAYSVATHNPVVDVHNVVYTRPNHPQLDLLRRAKTLADLRAYRFVTYIGNGWAATRLEPDGYAVQYVVDMGSVLNMVAGGRADLVVEDDIDLARQIAALGMQNRIVALPLVLETLSLHLLLGRASIHASRIEEIDRVLGEMQADGTTDRLIARQRGG